MADTKQQRAILRTSRAARRTRARFPAGTRFHHIEDPEHTGVVLRHVPGTNAQGGTLTVRWDSGFTGRLSPINAVPLSAEGGNS